MYERILRFFIQPQPYHLEGRVYKEVLTLWKKCDLDYGLGRL